MTTGTSLQDPSVSDGCTWCTRTPWWAKGTVMPEAETDAHNGTPPGRPMSRKASWGMFATSVVVVLATTVSPPLLRMFGPELWKALGITELQWSIFLAARGLFLILFVLAAGIAGDLYGRRRVLLIALWGFLISSLAAAAAPQPIAFLIIQSLLPIFDSFVKVMSVTILLLAFEGRGRVYAITGYSAIYAAAFVVAPVLAEQVGQAAEVRAAVYVGSILLTAAGLLLVAKIVPESRASDRVRPLDAVALSAWIAGVCAIIFGLVLAGSVGWARPLVLGTLAAGGATLLALAWLERHPVMREWRFNLRFEGRLSVTIVAGVLLNLALYAVAVQIFNFLRRVQGYDAIQAALALAPVLVGAFLLGALAARLTVRVGLRDALSIGLLLVAAAAGGFAWLQPDVPYWAVAPLLTLLGFGFIAGNSPYLLLLSSSVPLNLSATVQAIGRTTSQLGGALAYTFMLALISGFGGRAYVEQVKSIGVSQAEAAEQVSSLAAAAGDASWVLATDAEIRALDLMAPGFKLAYTTGLSRAMLILALMCVFGAALVRFGLKVDPDKQR